MEEGLRQCDQRGLFQHFKSLNIENTRKVSSQYIRDQEGVMLRDPGVVLGRWAWFFGTLLNSKSDQLRLNIIEALPQRPITHALGVKPAQKELIGALRSMANAKVVRSDELPVALFKLGINRDPTVLREFHRVIKLGTNGKSGQNTYGDVASGPWSLVQVAEQAYPILQLS